MLATRLLLAIATEALAMANLKLDKRDQQIKLLERENMELKMRLTIMQEMRKPDSPAAQPDWIRDAKPPAASPLVGIVAGKVPCQNAAHMGEFACANRAQCWEPCGELGHSKEHARRAPDEAQGAAK